MDKAIVTVLLVIVSVTCVMFISNALFPAVTRSSAALVSMTGGIDERIKSQVEIIHAVGYTSPEYAVVWVKNIGSSRIGAIENSDIFFGPEGDFSRVAYGVGSPSYWEYELENDTEWKPTATLRITITHPVSAETTYFLKMVIPNGISDEYYFSTP